MGKISDFFHEGRPPHFGFFKKKVPKENGESHSHHSAKVEKKKARSQTPERYSLSDRSIIPEDGKRSTPNVSVHKNLDGLSLTKFPWPEDLADNKKRGVNSLQLQQSRSGSNPLSGDSANTYGTSEGYAEFCKNMTKPLEEK